MTTVGDPKLADPHCCSGLPDSVRSLAVRLRDELHSLMRQRSLKDPLGRIAPELSSAQVHAIIALALENAPLSMSSLAQRTDTTLPAATGIVDRLERDGFIERLRDDQDRRLVLVNLTDKGRDTARQADEHLVTNLCQFIVALPEEERDTFVDSVCRAIAIVCGAASKPPSEVP